MYTMKKHIALWICLTMAMPLCAQPASDHYGALNNKSSQNLWDAIVTCTNKGFHTLGYNGLLEAYKKTDVDDDGNLIDMYGGCSFPFSKACGNYDKECDCYNREHSMPKSWWGGGNEKTNQGCDIFHVVPTDGYVNNRRSNYAFGEVVTNQDPDYQYNGNKLGLSAMSGYSGTVFEPQDEYKGDFARGYFGTMAKWELNPTSGYGASTFTGTYTASGNFGLTQYGTDLLLKWHRQDPVSEKELKRNDSIEATQGNRNPFIDYPELAEYVWGNKKGQTVVLSNLTLSYDAVTPVTDPTLMYPIDGETIAFGKVYLENTATKTFLVKGKLLTDTIRFAIAGDDARFFSVSPSFVTAAQANAGHNVAVIFTPEEEGDYAASLSVSGQDFRVRTLTLTGNVAVRPETPDTVIVPDGDYYLLEEEPVDWCGVYLIVNTDNNKCVNGAKATTTAEMKTTANTMDVTISNNIIAASETVDRAAVTIVPASGSYAMLASTGNYVGISENNNTFNVDSEPIPLNLSFNADNTVTVAGTGSFSGRSLRYNISAKMFRFYSSGQDAVTLFRKVQSQSPETAVENASDYSLRMENSVLVFSSTAEKHVCVYDIFGRCHFSAETGNMSLALPQGIYVVTVNGQPTKIIR